MSSLIDRDFASGLVRWAVFLWLRLNVEIPLFIGFDSPAPDDMLLKLGDVSGTGPCVLTHRVSMLHSHTKRPAFRIASHLSENPRLSALCRY